MKKGKKRNNKEMLANLGRKDRILRGKNIKGNQRKRNIRGSQRGNQRGK